jgi:hypothetical protein
MQEALNDGIANVIIESNSVLRFLRPDLYLTVLDAAVADFKRSALAHLDRADAVLMHNPAALSPRWKKVSPKLYLDKPTFYIESGEYVTSAMVSFVRERLAAAQSPVLR